MTDRDAVIQAHVELGFTADAAERKLKMSNGLFPGPAAAVSHCPLPPGRERECIGLLKLIFRKFDANPEAVQDLLRTAIQKRAINN